MVEFLHHGSHPVMVFRHGFPVQDHLLDLWRKHVPQTFHFQIMMSPIKPASHVQRKCKRKLSSHENGPLSFSAGARGGNCVVFFYLVFAFPRFIRVKCKRKEMENSSFLACAFAFALR